MNDLEYSLGLKVDGFNAGAHEVISTTKEIHHELRGIRTAIEAGGVAAVSIEFLRNMAEWAEKSGDKLEDNVQALLRWKKAAEDTGGIKSALASVIQPFIAAGETIGLMFRAIADAGKMAGSSDSPVQYIKNLGAAWANVVDVRAKSLELDKQEAAHGEETKKQLAEQLALRKEVAAESARLDTAERSYDLSKMTAQERVNALQNEYNEAIRAVDESKGTILDKEKLSNEARRISLELLKAEDELQKATEEDARKSAEASLEKAKAEGKVTEELIRQAEAAEKAAAKAKLIADTIEKLNQQAYESTTFGLINSKYSSDQISAASPEAINEAIRRLNDELILLRQNPGSAFNYGSSLDITKDENTIAALQNELRLRTQISTASLSSTTLDPLTFDRLSKGQGSTSAPASAINVRIAQGLEDLNKTLKSGVPTAVIGSGP